MAASGSSFTLTDASSIANGNPSRRTQMSLTRTALSSVNSKSGLIARARSTKSMTAGDFRIKLASSVVAVGNASGGTGHSVSQLK